jgi:hypothetical protein
MAITEIVTFDVEVFFFSNSGSCATVHVHVHVLKTALKHIELKEKERRGRTGDGLILNPSGHQLD